MPMCQSPKIDDVLFRARSLPANDNYFLVVTGRNTNGSKSTCRALWPTLVILLGVSVLLFL
jgi:hypothetical protein